MVSAACARMGKSGKAINKLMVLEQYVQLAIWDKGLAHIAGNVNGKTIRQLPVVTFDAFA